MTGNKPFKIYFYYITWVTHPFHDDSKIQNISKQPENTQRWNDYFSDNCNCIPRSIFPILSMLSPFINGIIVITIYCEIEDRQVFIEIPVRFCIMSDIFCVCWFAFCKPVLISGRSNHKTDNLLICHVCFFNNSSIILIWYYFPFLSSVVKFQLCKTSLLYKISVYGNYRFRNSFKYKNYLPSLYKDEEGGLNCLALKDVVHRPII